MIIFCTSIVTLCCLVSCNVVAGVLYVTTPDPEQIALFDLPQKKTVVFVDDRHNIMHPSRLKGVVADKVTSELLGHELLVEMIAPRDAMRYAESQDRQGSILTIGAIGEAVHASVVIYIEVSTFVMTVDGHNPAPLAGCSVRVVDVESRAQLFPSPDSTDTTHKVRSALHRADPHQLDSVGETRKLAHSLAQKMGEDIAKLFYTHTTGRLGENLERK
jgi:Na+-transporting NADH:ubiquinone oxidoreductase subunit NqrC